MEKYNQLKTNIILDFYIDVICEKLQVKKENVMRKKSKYRELADIRAMACYMTKEVFPEAKLKHIAEYFDQTHSTVLYSINKVKDLKGLDVKITETVNYCQYLNFVEAILKSNGFEKVDNDVYQILVGYQIARVFVNDSLMCDIFGEYSFSAENIDIFDAIIIVKNINSDPIGTLINKLKN